MQSARIEHTTSVVMQTDCPGKTSDRRHNEPLDFAKYQHEIQMFVRLGFILVYRTVSNILGFFRNSDKNMKIVLFYIK